MIMSAARKQGFNVDQFGHKVKRRMAISRNQICVTLLCNVNATCLELITEIHLQARLKR